MATKKQVAANRRNAKKGTGPKTPEGKARSSMNRLRDGLYSNTLILPGEDKAQYDQLHQGLQACYQPQNAAEQVLVDQLAATKWKMIRVELIETGVLIEYGDKPAGELLPLYDRVTRIAARLQRLWLKLYKELETIKAARPQKEPQRPTQPPSPIPSPRRRQPPHPGLHCVQIKNLGRKEEARDNDS